MTFLVGIPTLTRYDLLDRCLECVRSSTVEPARILIVDNGNKFVDREGVEVYRPGRNLGVAASWNLICRDAYGDGLTPFILNDDVRVAPDCFERMQERPEPIVLAPWWQCFTLEESAWKLIGPFDENFYPAYCEDVDYLYRAKLAGVEVGKVEGVSDHGPGSGTVRMMTPEVKNQFLRGYASWRYYEAKWGGLHGREVYTKPFDGKP